MEWQEAFPILLIVSQTITLLPLWLNTIQGIPHLALGTLLWGLPPLLTSHPPQAFPSPSTPPPSNRGSMRR